MYSSSKHFSAGADVEHIKANVLGPAKAGMSREDIVSKFIRHNGQILRDLELLPVPVIASISGFCVGSGL